ncbi:MAG: hypothetical protein OXI37_10145 [Gammaproteobacteria bacterium]|nr:hypothetical protein [Gammaproteobacteria bacterium]
MDELIRDSLTGGNPADHIAMANKRRREYLILLDNAKAAAITAVDAYNRVNHPCRNETTLILLTNAWELLAKAVLVQAHLSIRKGQRGDTISAEAAISKLLHRKDLIKHEAETVQQVISLRHAAVHHFLPPIPDEVMQHLLFFGCKFFREVVKRHFKAHSKDLEQNFLSLSFMELTTYADKIKKVVSRVKKNSSDRKLAWLLERGIEFDGTQYLTEKQFSAKYRGKKQVMPYLSINKFLGSTDMVRVVPIQAPRNYTADISLRKGSSRDASLPVLIKKTELEKDYPYLTKELANKVGKNVNFVAKATHALGLKGDPKYHLAIRSSKSSAIQRYSEAAVQHLRSKLVTEPDYNPYKQSAFDSSDQLN